MKEALSNYYNKFSDFRQKKIYADPLICVAVSIAFAGAYVLSGHIILNSEEGYSQRNEIHCPPVESIELNGNS